MTDTHFLSDQPMDVNVPSIHDDVEPTGSDDDAAVQNVDPRHARRITLMQQMFAFTFHSEETQAQQFQEHHPEIAEILPHLEKIDAEIQTLAPERPISEINKVDLAILRIIMFEWKTSDTPKKVLIDEAVELAKEFGTESSSRFVNGVLGKLFT